MVIPEIFYSTVHNKCPRCHKGQVFETNNPFRLSKAFQMTRSCPVCKLKYERETGFFYGAMYVSYALMSGLFIVWFVLNVYVFHLPALILAFSVTASILLLFPVAYRWARLIWLNFFVRYDKSWKVHKQIIEELKDKHVDITSLKPNPHEL